MEYPQLFWFSPVLAMQRIRCEAGCDRQLLVAMKDTDYVLSACVSSVSPVLASTDPGDEALTVWRAVAGGVQDGVLGPAAAALPQVLGGPVREGAPPGHVAGQLARPGAGGG